MPPSVLDAALRVFVAWQMVWGLAAFVAVWRDKVLAQGGRGRTPERDLHRLEAWGGWLGSFLAQWLFRHKTRKAAYQRVFRRLMFVWLLAWAAVVAARVLLAR